MAVNPNTTFVAGAILTAAQMNRLPWGVMDYATKTASQTGITGTVIDISGLTLTFTAVSTRVYRTTVWALVRQNTSPGAPVIQITDGANVQKTEADVYIAAAANFATFVASCIETGLSGSTTRKARGVSNTATWDLVASATFPAYITVEDIGQA